MNKENNAFLIYCQNIGIYNENKTLDEHKQCFQEVYLQEKDETDHNYNTSRYISFALNGREPDFCLGKWCYFPDIEMSSGFNMAFGQVVGFRNTHSWIGIKYFVTSGITGKTSELGNTKPLLLCEKIDGFDYLLPENPTILRKLVNNFNIQGFFFDEEKKEQRLGKFIGFNDKSDEFSILDIKNKEIKLFKGLDSFFDIFKDLHEEGKEISFSFSINK